MGEKFLVWELNKALLIYYKIKILLTNRKSTIYKINEQACLLGLVYSVQFQIA